MTKCTGRLAERPPNFDCRPSNESPQRWDWQVKIEPSIIAIGPLFNGFSKMTQYNIVGID